MYDLVNYKMLHFPVGIYILPVIIFLIIAAATYQNSCIRYSRYDTYDDKYDEMQEPEVFEKAKPNWPLSILAGIFITLLIFVFDFLLSFLK